MIILYFFPTIDMHGNEECCLEFFYDKALDDGPMLLDDINCATIEDGIGDVLTSVKWSPIPFESDQSSCYKILKSGFGEVLINFDPTILELDKNCVFVDHENHALCDDYIVVFVHDSTENYYERGKYGCRNFHVTKTPLFVLKILNTLVLHSYA